ncbi:MAG: FlgD immunoglobulin-like domain containing protein [Candidatus Eisenbacteria bacterium]
MRSASRFALLLVASLAAGPAASRETGPHARAVSPARLEELNGSRGAPVVGAARWRQAVHEVRRAAEGGRRFPESTAIRLSANERARSGAVPIGVLDARVPSPGGDSEGTVVFAAAALTGHTYRGSEVRFVLDEERYLATGDPPARIAIDFEDGNGFRGARFGEPLLVRYRSEGERTVRLRALDDEGADRQAAFRFDVRALRTPLPDDTLAITATEPYLGEFGTGEAYVYLSGLNASLTNPVVVIEGFDLDDTMNWDELYALLNQQNLVETLRAEGFDAVVLNFTSATDYMQRNAFVVEALLEEVAGAIDPGSDVALVGASMGGLCSRYALSWMETHSIDHRVRSYLSFDAPQLGANIPLGIQYWLVFFADLSAEAEFLLGRLDTPAARQLLVYHHTAPPGATGESDSLRAEFEADLSAVGGWPSLPRRVAIANGSGHGAGQGFSAGDRIINYEHDGLLVDIRGNVWAVPDGGAGMILDGLIRIWPLPATTMQVTVSGTAPYDNAPGGYRSSMADMDSTEAPYGDIVALHPSHCFVPTVSALAVDTSDLFYIAANDSDILSLTPFDALYFPAENQEHVEITPESAEWFLGEIRRATGVASDGAPPRLVVLSNRPNPFNPATELRFTTRAAARARLTIHDAAGRTVATLADGELSPGEHAVLWDGRDLSGDGVASGTYFARLLSGDRILTRKITLVR